MMKTKYMQLPVMIVVLLPLLAAVTNCNKPFDEPPVYTVPSITANTTIRTLRSLHAPGGLEQIMDDAIVEGVVIADDREDNFYKSLVIQDSTGGITVRMDGYTLFNTYPVGSRIFIRLKGLWLGEYGRMVQLGGGVDRKDPVAPVLTAIAPSLFNRYIVRSGTHHVIEPMVVTMDQLADSLQSRLIRIEQVEFSPADTGRPYADVINKQAVNHTLKACGGGSVYVRTSAFAKFAGMHTPGGNGSITGIYSVFKTEKQLIIRDTADVQLEGLRCVVSGPRLLFSEDFEDITIDTDLALAGWKNIAEAGDSKFRGKRLAGNSYAEVSAFATGQPNVITWLITPAISLGNKANALLNVKTKDGFDNGAVLQVMVSTNYDGGNTPWKARWTPLNANISKGSVSGIAPGWANSGNISLKSYSGSNIYIAFRYNGADPGKTDGKRTTTFRVDDIIISGN